MINYKKKARATVARRQGEDKRKLIMELREMPMISIACERAGLSRMSYYRWIATDKKFAGEVKEAIRMGESFICDRTEVAMLRLAEEGKVAAGALLLRTYHPRYGMKTDPISKARVDEPLTPEETKLIERAVSFMSPPRLTDTTNKAAKPKTNNNKNQINE